MASRSPMRILFLILIFSGTLSANIPADYEYIECALEPLSKAMQPHSHPRIPVARHLHLSDTDTDTDVVKTSYTSNWAGYVAQTNLTNPAPGSVTKVTGSWVVPTIYTSSMDTHMAIWTGIDGSGSPSIEQVGTSHFVIGGVHQHFAWIEMYPQPPLNLTGFPVEVGDSITASVTCVTCNTVLPAGSELFIVQITNNTKKLYTIVPFIIANAKRLSAEWIVEAPNFDGITPLTRFDTIRLTDCLTTINNRVGGINNPAWMYDPINMVTTSVVPKATPSAVAADGKSFSVDWKGY